MRNLVRNTHLKSLSVQKQQQKRAYYNISHIHNYKLATLYSVFTHLSVAPSKLKIQSSNLYKKNIYICLYTSVLRNKSEKTNRHIYAHIQEITVKKKQQIQLKSELQINTSNLDRSDT